MANKPVDDDVMEWAKEVLGFGEEVGKIDEVRESLEPSNPTVRTELAALPETMVAPELLATVKEKNLNAKLGRLNSLKRNVNAYINSKSPKFAAVQAFVVASAEADLAQAAADAANAAVTAEQAELAALNAELGALNGLPPAATPEEQAAREAQIAELNAQITEQQGAVTAAEEAAAQAQAAADEAARTPTRRRSRQRWS